jgi:hypothetical protein
MPPAPEEKITEIQGDLIQRDPEENQVIETIDAAPGSAARYAAGRVCYDFSYGAVHRPLITPSMFKENASHNDPVLNQFNEATDFAKFSMGDMNAWPMIPPPRQAVLPKISLFFQGSNHRIKGDPETPINPIPSVTQTLHAQRKVNITRKLASPCLLLFMAGSTAPNTTTTMPTDAMKEKGLLARPGINNGQSSNTAEGSGTANWALAGGSSHRNRGRSSSKRWALKRRRRPS